MKQDWKAFISVLLLVVTWGGGILASYSLPGPKDPNYCYIQWMHPPKTASTFCLSIQHACVEDTFLSQADAHTRLRINFGCPIMEPEGSFFGSRYHTPLMPPDYSELKRFVTMLRHPDDRLVSAFADNMHMEGLNKTTKEELFAQLEGGHRGNFANSAEVCDANFRKYAAFRGNHGCYAKMLNGFECHEDVVVTPEMLETAKERLRAFMFVGLFEQYETSIHVFLKVAEQVMDASKFRINKNVTDSFLYRHRLLPPHPVEIKPLRKTKSPCMPHLQRIYRRSAAVASPVPNSEMKREYRDKVDGQIYDLAVELFHTKRMELNVPQSIPNANQAEHNHQNIQRRNQQFHQRHRHNARNQHG